jgi:PAS domain S-box-containing protein
MGEAVRDALGVIQRIDGAVQDISESKQKAVEIRELAARMTTTLESITDAFFTLDRAWRFTFLNGAAERLLQRTRAELIGEDWRTEFSAAVDSTFGKEYRRAITENHSVAFEEFYLPLKTWFSVRAYPSGEGLAVYFLDITERKHLEEANARALQRLTEAQRIGLIGDWEYDLATGITWSAQVFKIFGRDPSLGAPRSLGDAGRMYDSASSALMAEKVAEAIRAPCPATRRHESLSSGDLLTKHGRKRQGCKFARNRPGYLGTKTWRAGTQGPGPPTGTHRGTGALRPCRHPS